MDAGSSVRSQIYSGQNVIHKRKKLPEKFESLRMLFESLVSVIRLLRLRGSASNFSNICSKIEYLTDRRFSYDHLAQLKFILPEAIEIEKVLVFDERTSFMKPDLHISFNSTVLESQGNLVSEIRSMHLKKLFHTRLSEFVSSHPEIDEVPKELLPWPFDRSSEPARSSTNISEKIPFNHLEEGSDLHVNAAPKSTSPTRFVSGPCKEEKLVRASHLPRSFRRHFSQKGICRGEKIELDIKPCTQDASQSGAGASTETVTSNVESLSKASSPIKLSSTPTFSSDCSENFASPLRLSAMPFPGTPSNGAGKKIKTNEDDLSAKSNDIYSTPAKDISTPVRLMVNTPAMPPPKRSYLSPDDNSICSPNKLARRPPRSRSLIFDTPTKKKQNDDEIDDFGE